MATENKIYQVLKEKGLFPLENKTIIVKYAPANLSAKIAGFFNNELYVLQLCEDKLVLLPITVFTATLKKEVSLEISYSEIKSVEIKEDMLNYNISISTDTDTICLTTQQKELSSWRVSGCVALNSDGLFKFQNWHKSNLDGTLETLKSIC